MAYTPDVSRPTAALALSRGFGELRQGMDMVVQNPLRAPACSHCCRSSGTLSKEDD